MLVDRIPDHLGQGTGDGAAQPRALRAEEHLNPVRGALIGAEIRRRVDRRRSGGGPGAGHVHAGERGEDLPVEVVVEVAGVATVGEQGHRQALLGQQPQERRLAERVAVVAEQPLIAQP